MKVVMVFLKDSGGEERLTASWDKAFHKFPVYVMFGLNKYEMVMYDHDRNENDTMIAYYAKISPTDGRWSKETYVDTSDIVGRTSGCVCGSKYTSFPNAHMLYCSMWRPFK